ncbi:MAG TPA: ABC transporter permease [Ruminococcaceae bacterium]|nr:ABC transporter permease [Oscillospiraceae bacterium]
MMSASRKRQRREWSLLSRIIRARGCYAMLAPFYILFFMFIILPILGAAFLSFTDFNMLEIPAFVGLENYARLFFDDDVFLIAANNTFIFAVITGPISYFACLIFAWLINELNPKLRAILTFVFYAPSISGMLFVMWGFIFSGDMYGYLNYFLMSLGFINQPVQWLTNSETVLGVVIVVQIWMSLGTSFLSFIAGLQNVDRQLYEAAAVDGVRNRLQELLYVTLPSMGPQLLFGAVMQIGAAFSVSSICMTLAGFPSTDNAALTIVTHIYDYGNVRFEMGYACAVSMVLFVLILSVNHVIQRIITRVADV